MIEANRGGSNTEPGGWNQSEANLTDTRATAGMDEAEKRKLVRLTQSWMRRIDSERRAHADFRDRAEEVEKVYRDQLDSKDIYYPLFWSVVQAQHSGIYSNQPVPDVRSRGENDEAGKQAAQVLENGISFCIDYGMFDDNVHRVVDDFLITGLGVPRLKFDSEVTEEPVIDPMTGQPAMDPMTGEMITQPVIASQLVRWEHCPWRRFMWEPCQNWKHCDWVGFQHRLTRQQIRDQFDADIDTQGAETDSTTDKYKPRTTVYEIWSKPDRKVFYFAEGSMLPLDIEEDPLGLENFFPCPPPIMTNVASDELVPMADYEFIEKYQHEMNRLSQRRMAILEQIKAVSMHDASLPEIASVFDAHDGDSIAVANLVDRLASVNGANFQSVMAFLPIQERVQALEVLTGQMQVLRETVDDILGISDIVRGVTNAAETATAQEIKGRWVGIRLSRKREQVQYMIREMMRMTGEALVEHITPENLTRMTQVQVTPELMMVLRDDMLRDFSVDIESESTVAKDEFEERRTRQEMLQALGGYANTVLPAVQSGFMTADLAAATLRAAIQPYAKYSKQLDQALADLPNSTQQLQQMQQQLQELQMQMEQMGQEAQYWQAEAQRLQQQASEAKAMREQAEAGKKDAERRKIETEIGDQALQPQKTVAEIGKIHADTEKARAEVGKTGAEVGNVRADTLKTIRDAQRPDFPQAGRG